MSTYKNTLLNPILLGIFGVASSGALTTIIALGA